MNKKVILNLMRSGIISLWAVWFTLVSLSDSANFLQQVQVLPKDFAFSSRNYDLISKSLAVYGIQSSAVALILFGALVVWAFLIAISFWAALFIKRSSKTVVSYFAFLLTLAMSACFMLWDEIFLQYDLEHSLMIRFSFQLITLITFFILSKNIDESKVVL